MGNKKLSKKAAVLANAKKAKQRKIIVPSAIVIVVLFVVVIFYVSSKSDDRSVSVPVSDRQTYGDSAPAPSARTTAKKSTVKAQNGVVTLKVADFSDKQARYFTYAGESKKLSFFVLQSSDGVIRAAFDACDVCYAQKKGYRQEGDLMVCNNCGQRFPSIRINVEKGGCNPSPLNRNIVGEDLIIQVADIESGGIYF